jgi:hypothetical protein
MASVAPYWSPPKDWQGQEDQFRSAYQRAVSQFNFQKNQLMQGAGFTGVADVENWNRDASGRLNYGQLNIDASNDQGQYQQMRIGQGQEVQGINRSFAGRGIGLGSGLSQVVADRAREGHRGALDQWTASIVNNLGGLGQAVDANQAQYSSNLANLNFERTQWEGLQKLYEEVNKEPTPSAGGGTGAASPPAGARPGTATTAGTRQTVQQLMASPYNRATGMKVLGAIDRGDLTTLAQLYHTATDPNMKLAIDAELKRLRARPGRPKFVPKPDPAPSVPRPDPYPGR